MSELDQLRIVGVSFKQYFGFQQTLDWCRAAIDHVGEARLELFVLPTFPTLVPVIDLLAGTPIAVGAQDLAARDDGAQTGEVLGSLLAEIGCRYVAVGHAERRRDFGETEEIVAAKTAAALRHGLTPVLCLGEPDHVDPARAASECERQLSSALEMIRADGLQGRLVIAYEPQWAIGAARPAPDDHIRTVCGRLREAARGLEAHPQSAVIYGGSAQPGLLSRLGDSVDGLFLGRFAHDVDAFGSVVREAVAEVRA